MYEIKVISHFCAAHYLENYKGKCEALHGHNWKVEAVLAASKLDSRGMVADFADIKRLLSEVTKKLDHAFLNDLDFFKNKNTTSEYIARYIYEALKKKIATLYKSSKTGAIVLKEVAVWEQENSCATYRT